MLVFPNSQTIDMAVTTTEEITISITALFFFFLRLFEPELS